jgi:DNA-binding response OmpR family regulator
MMGYAFTVADSGEIALKILEGLQPDLIFLDVGMPGTDGLATLGKLHEKYEHLKVIMLADQKEIPKATMALNLGAGDFITKPVDLPSVKRVLQIHLPK